jgi:hypothetical protein
MGVVVPRVAPELAMTVNPFVILLLVMNVVASVWFAVRGFWPWALIYSGAAVIQDGTLCATR